MHLNKRYKTGRRSPGTPYFSEDEIPPLVISGSLALVYLADRTSFWLKEQKDFNAWTFALVSLMCLAAGLSSVKQADKDLGFLNRDQTDEWKGWMQSMSVFRLFLCKSSRLLQSLY
jgi:N-acetylneuraminate 9-O-acetyltransferase